jgi:hypothetical protein
MATITHIGLDVHKVTVSIALAYVAAAARSARLGVFELNLHQALLRGRAPSRHWGRRPIP